MDADTLRGEVMQLNTVDSYRSTVNCTTEEYENILRSAIEKLKSDSEIEDFVTDKYGDN